MLEICNNRKDSECEKWGKYKNQDILPMWVADSEFFAAPAIQEALLERVKQGVFGYPELTQRFKKAVVNHCKALYNWEIKEEWVFAIPGVVPGLNIARGLSISRGKKHGLTFDPTYPHLRRFSPLLDFSQTNIPQKGETFYPDMEALENAVQKDTGLLLLCHPHNPVAYNYSSEDLQNLSDFAKKHDLIVCSDEIHCDLVLNGEQHRPFASINEDALNRTVTLMAASKTYNVAGLYCSYVIIANDELRQEFQALRYGLVGEPNLLGQIATIAALECGEEWRQEHLNYLRENAELTEHRINATGILKMEKVNATFLAWIDARALNVDNPQKFFEKHGVGLSDGADFGRPGFVRLNFGCGREMLESALNRIEVALKTL